MKYSTPLLVACIGGAALVSALPTTDRKPNLPRAPATVDTTLGHAAPAAAAGAGAASRHSLPPLNRRAKNGGRRNRNKKKQPQQKPQQQQQKPNQQQGQREPPPPAAQQDQQDPGSTTSKSERVGDTLGSLAASGATFAQAAEGLQVRAQPGHMQERTATRALVDALVPRDFDEAARAHVLREFLEALETRGLDFDEEMLMARTDWRGKAQRVKDAGRQLVEKAKAKAKAKGNAGGAADSGVVEDVPADPASLTTRDLGLAARDLDFDLAARDLDFDLAARDLDFDLAARDFDFDLSTRDVDDALAMREFLEARGFDIDDELLARWSWRSAKQKLKDIKNRFSSKGKSGTAVDTTTTTPDLSASTTDPTMLTPRDLDFDLDLVTRDFDDDALAMREFLEVLEARGFDMDDELLARWSWRSAKQKLKDIKNRFSSKGKSGTAVDTTTTPDLSTTTDPAMLTPRDLSEDALHARDAFFGDIEARAFDLDELD